MSATLVDVGAAAFALVVIVFLVVVVVGLVRRRPWLTPKGIEARGVPPYEAPLAIPDTLVGSGKTVSIEVRPQLSLVVHKLYVPTDVAVHFAINEVMVGRAVSFLDGRHPVAAGAFTEKPGSGVNTTLCRLGSVITVVVTNQSDKPRRFQGASLFATVLGVDG